MAVVQKGEKMYEVTIDKETGLPIMDNSFARVVRCKDCIYQTECGFTEWLGRNGNGFCSSGERKDNADN